MPTLNINRPAIMVDGLIKQRYSYYNSVSGLVEKRTHIIEDEEFKTVSKSVIDNVNEKIQNTVYSSITESVVQVIIDNVNSSISFVTEVVNLDFIPIISTGYEFASNSLSVYLNGINITDNCIILSNKTFSIDSEYGVDNSGEFKVLVSYIRNNAEV